VLYIVLLITEDVLDTSSAIHIGAKESLAVNTSETMYQIRTFSSGLLFITWRARNLIDLLFWGAKITWGFSK